MHRKLLTILVLAATAGPALADSTVPLLTAATSLTTGVTYVANGGVNDTKMGFNTAVFGLTAGNLTINSAGITNAMLANSATTVNTVSCALGGSCTVAAAAGTLTGTTLAAGVTASSLTSVGTLGTLTVGGAVTLTGLTTGTQVSCLGLDASNIVRTSAGACGTGGGGGVGTITGGGNTTTGVTTLAFGNGFIATPNGASATATVNTTITDVTKTANYTVAAADMANALNLGGTTATLTLPAASASIFAPGMSLTVYVSASGTWTLTNSTGLTYTGPTSLPPGTQGTFIANANGTSLDFFGTTLGTGVATAAATTLSAAGGLTTTIASGTSALATAAIASATCAAAITTAATNTATTDVVLASFNGDPTAVTGYIPATAGMLTIVAYPTANNVNFKVCNNTSSSITPGAITLNWRVVR